MWNGISTKRHVESISRGNRHDMRTQEIENNTNFVRENLLNNYTLIDFEHLQTE